MRNKSKLPLKNRFQLEFFFASNAMRYVVCNCFCTGLVTSIFSHSSNDKLILFAIKCHFSWFTRLFCLNFNGTSQGKMKICERKQRKSYFSCTNAHLFEYKLCHSQTTSIIFSHQFYRLATTKSNLAHYLPLCFFNVIASVN